MLCFEQLCFYAGWTYCNSNLLGVSTEDEPTAAKINELATSIRDKAIPMIAEGTPGDTYTGMLVYNTCFIVDGLGGECASAP